jgi:hypothetical protein
MSASQVKQAAGGRARTASNSVSSPNRWPKVKNCARPRALDRRGTLGSAKSALISEANSRRPGSCAR